jgi:hypothetical protein
MDPVTLLACVKLIRLEPLHMPVSESVHCSTMMPERLGRKSNNVTNEVRFPCTVELCWNPCCVRFPKRQGFRGARQRHLLSSKGIG